MVSWKICTCRDTCQEQDGTLLTNKSEHLLRWHENFSELFTIQTATLQSPVQRVEKAIKSMKSNKAPGYDPITAEMLKADSRLSEQVLHPIFRDIWENQRFPVD